MIINKATFQTADLSRFSLTPRSGDEEEPSTTPTKPDVEPDIQPETPVQPEPAPGPDPLTDPDGDPVPPDTTCPTRR